MKRKFVHWGVIVFEVILIYSLVKGIESSLASRGRVESLDKQKEELLAQREELTRRLEYVESEDYLEMVAREELNLAKPGETVVLVPDGVEWVSRTPEGEPVDRREIWEKWRDVFWGGE